MTEPTDLFDAAQKFPNPSAGARYDRLVGLDGFKERLLKEARLLLDPQLLHAWSRKHHGGAVLPAVELFGERIPLFVFAGDVGTGKTALAETFGNELARASRISVTLMPLSLNARGTGRVGEMTSLIASAFRAVEERVAGQRGAERPTSAVIVLIDEADALAQSREASQMHHEDRAGVNALIRGISHVSAEGMPVITVMCTNRASAIDPAIKRRAAQIFHFERPNDEQRADVLKRAFEGAGLSEAHLADLVRRTGSVNGRSYGYTYSDLTMRLIPGVLIDAFPDRHLDYARIREIVEAHPPTAPFSDSHDA
ncbi:MAG TPA: AAA family ATPase [Solirubrobacteraceae bacterium]|jgi:SpoVK/Ycf46/Vps4 family AAA+-type ATPase|nr:AAA family ATPase [Solirubrobacteraceae bacterium]